jgi:exopolyphosphatase / guanosine-5'-triphosphate,3'-diphosphate pyrophosphatase
VEVARAGAMQMYPAGASVLPMTDRGPGRIQAPANNEPDIAASRDRRLSILDFGQRFDDAEGHARCVARLALALFHASHAVHGLDSHAAELLEYGALLHDIGLSISHSKHQRHSHYLILNSGLKNFSAEEVEVIAILARYHRGTPPRNSSAELARFTAGTRKMVMALVAILRVADGLDRSHRGAARRIELVREEREWCARVTFGERDIEPELWAASHKADAWQRYFGAPLRIISAGDETAVARPDFSHRWNA